MSDCNPVKVGMRQLCYALVGDFVVVAYIYRKGRVVVVARHSERILSGPGGVVVIQVRVYLRKGQGEKRELEEEEKLGMRGKSYGLLYQAA